MTCESCQTKVQNLLLQVEGVNEVNINRHKSEADISMTSHVKTSSLQQALKAYPKYQISEKEVAQAAFEEEPKSWWQTYKPVLLIFAYIVGISFLIQFTRSSFDWMLWMNHFMAGFFLVFSFFKLLNLQGFADSYATYDILAKRWRAYAFVYAFTELLLGLAYLSGYAPLLTNLVTVTVMSLSLVGVLQSLSDKKKIKCACLGDVFNLPMSAITVIEDVLMIVMSAIMLIALV